MRAFRALTAEELGGVIKRSLVMKNTKELSKGEVLVKVKYSCLNYYDILVLAGDRCAGAKYPITPGLDAAGIVVESVSDDFKPGDEVLITGYGMGTTVDGGLGEYIKVPAQWLISLPTGLTLKDAMTIGTEGLAAAIAVMEITSAGIDSKSKDILITGASIGTGAFATGIMSLCGYNVTAVTTKKNNDDFIQSIGAKKIIHYDDFIDKSEAMVLEEKYCAAIDTFGGDALRTIVMSIEKNGSVASCNMMLSKTATIPIQSIMSKGINILGIDAINCPKKLRLAAWYNLSGEWYLKTLPWLCDEISLLDIEEYIVRYVKGDVKGRIVVNHEM